MLNQIFCVWHADSLWWLEILKTFECFHYTVWIEMSSYIFNKLPYSLNWPTFPEHEEMLALVEHMPTNAHHFQELKADIYPPCWYRISMYSSTMLWRTTFPVGTPVWWPTSSRCSLMTWAKKKVDSLALKDSLRYHHITVLTLHIIILYNDRCTVSLVMKPVISKDCRWLYCLCLHCLALG